MSIYSTVLILKVYPTVSTRSIVNNKVFSVGHTHLKSFAMAKTLIDNCIKHKRPKTNNPYVITSHIRVADDDRYIMKLKQLLDVKKASHKDKYVNGSR